MPFRLTRSGSATVLAACVAGAALALPHSRPPAPAQFTGRQLAALLVPASALPRGYQLMRNIQQDSGKRLETAPARYDLATMSCAAIHDDNGRSGFGESAFAENGYLMVNLPDPHGTGLVQQVYQFRSPKAALSYWRGLRAIIIRCPGLGAAAAPDYAKVTQRVFIVRYGRDQAFEADITETGRQSGTVNMAMLVVVAGNDVFTADIIGYGRPVPADPSARTLMKELATRVQAAR